jgi:hypothetical protein
MILFFTFGTALELLVGTALFCLTIIASITVVNSLAYSFEKQ